MGARDDATLTSGPAGSAVRQEHSRFSDIDRGKGLAIFLVVLGHLVARKAPADIDWYLNLQAAIYQFHMPFFMYLSGFIALHTQPSLDHWAHYGRFVRKRALRLLLPFFLFGFAIIAGKLIFSQIMQVDKVPEDAGRAIRALFWDTHNSPAFSVWYIFVLFVYSAATPLLLRLFRNSVLLLLAFALALYFVPFPQIAYLDRVGLFFAFFMLGAVARRYHDRYLPLLDRYAPVALACFAASFVVWRAGLIPGNTESLFVMGVLSMPALHALVRLRALESSEILYVLGGYSFVIYLLNTIWIGLTKGVLLQFVAWDGPMFLVIAPLLLIAGIMGPILTKKYVFAYVPPLDRMTD
jgi:fucose 4-O-acetylase-like acetyltransferase